MPNEEVAAFAVTDTDSEPVHWLPMPQQDEVACGAEADEIDFDETEEITIEGLLELHSGDADIDLCDSCDEAIAEMMSR